MGFIGPRVARGSFIIFSREVLANLIALVGSIVVARLLGPEEYGLASIALIYPGIAVSIAGLSLGQAIVRFSSAGSVEGKASEYIYSGLFISLVSAALASLTIFVLSPYLAYTLNRPMLASGISILFIYVFSIILFSSIEASLLGLGRYGDTAVATVARALIRVSIAIPLALLGLGYRAVLWGLSIGYLIGALIGFKMLLRRSPPTKPRLNHANELLGYSLPLHIPALITSSINQAVTGFLAAKASDFEMGNLAVANLLLTPISMISSALGTAIFSSLPTLTDNDEKLRLAVNKSVLYTNMLIIPITLGMALLTKPLIFLPYGSSYSIAPSYLFLLLIPFIFNALAAQTVILYANTTGDTRFTGSLTLIDIAIRAPIVLLLIHCFGVIGYLLASVIVNPIVACITLFLGMKRYGLIPWLKRNAMVAVWSVTSFTLGLLTHYIVSSQYLEAAVHVLILMLTAKYFIMKEEAMEVVALSGSIPVIGNLLSRIGKTIVKKML